MKNNKFAKFTLAIILALAGVTSAANVDTQPIHAKALNSSLYDQAMAYDRDPIVKKYNKDAYKIVMNQKQVNYWVWHVKKSALKKNLSYTYYDWNVKTPNAADAYMKPMLGVHTFYPKKMKEARGIIASGSTKFNAVVKGVSYHPVEWSDHNGVTQAGYVPEKQFKHVFAKGGYIAYGDGWDQILNWNTGNLRNQIPQVGYDMAIKNNHILKLSKSEKKNYFSRMLRTYTNTIEKKIHYGTNVPYKSIADFYEQNNNGVRAIREDKADQGAYSCKQSYESGIYNPGSVWFEGQIGSDLS